MQQSSAALETEIQTKIDQKTKPPGALGQLETLAAKIASIQSTLTPKLSNPHIVVFAGDHGATDAGVSAFPKAVTAQMVMNFVSGGAAINVFSRQHQLALTVVDTGVDADFDDKLPIKHLKVRKSTSNFIEKPAMSEAELEQCFSQAEGLVADIAALGCNVIGFGEMGIGNTAASSLLMHQISGIPLEDCVGRGTGLDESGVAHKLKLLQHANAAHSVATPKAILATFGGFEIAHMTAAMLAAAERNMVVLVDGFIATAAFAVAAAIDPKVHDKAIFCHTSAEQGHQKLLDWLGAKPVLSMGMRLGEGTGCALAYPLLQSAVAFFNEMASFTEAGVSDKNPSP